MKKMFLLLAVASLSMPAMAQKAKKQAKGNTAAQPATPAAPEVPKMDPADRAAAMEQRAIGPMHNVLIQSGGHWRLEVKVWATPQQTEPSISRLESDGRVMAEGRFLVANIFGDMSKFHYEAQSVLGYDNVKRVFQKTWFDNLGTSILYLEGVYDEKANVIDFTGTTSDPRTRKPIKIHQILHLTDPQNQLLEVFMEKDGKEFKTMEIRSSRG